MSFWRNISPPVKYHGLINQGATCYLNSVLQVLFMTEDFRAAVERDTSENPDHDCIDRHLSSLFADLKEQEAYTYKITQKLGIIRVYEQQDAAEYFEKILRLIRSGASEIFCVQLTHKTVCTTCSAEAKDDAAFWHLPLALVDSNSEYSVVDGIEDYFRSSEFSGDNQMYCDQCDAKSDATIKCVIKHHPDVLMLLLKRFEFNYSYMTYIKINRTVEVPFTLQIPENQTYELYAVVDHFGDLRSGHYTATIKDDEGWYTFDDRRVTPSVYQPFQVDEFEKSSSAYLLFYRKLNVPAADTEDSMDTSAPEVILPANTSVYGQCQDGNMRMREEAEEAEEEGNVTMVSVSIDINEETGLKDSAGSTKVELPPDVCNTLKNQDIKSYSHHESNEETNNYQDVISKQQRGEEDVGGNAQADEQTEKRETQLEESVEVQNRDSGKQRRAEAEVSHRHEVHDRNKQDERSDRQWRVKTDIGGKTEDDEQGQSLIKYPDRAVKYQDNADNAREGLGGTQEAGRDDDVKSVSVQMEGKSGEGERSSEGEKLLELQDNRREGGSEGNMPGDDQMCKQGSSTMSNTHEQQREDKICVKEHKDGDDEHGQDVEDQNNDDNIRQKQPEQKISVAYTKQKVEGVKRRTEEQGKTREEHKADSSLRRAGSAGSRRLTENQRVGVDEKTRQHAPSQIRRAHSDDGDIDKRRDSKKSKVYGKIIEEEIQNTRSGTQISTVTEYIQIEKEESSQQSTLSMEFGNLLLEKPSMPEPKKHSIKSPFGKVQDGDETIVTTHSNSRKKNRLQSWWAQRKRKMQMRGKKRKSWQHREGKKKKSPGCFSMFQKGQKKEDNTSESD